LISFVFQGPLKPQTASLKTGLADMYEDVGHLFKTGCEAAHAAHLRIPQETVAVNQEVVHLVGRKISFSSTRLLCAAPRKHHAFGERDVAVVIAVDEQHGDFQVPTYAIGDVV
jgi:hypothetical protein